jgi:hypothetical protein
MDRFLEEGLIDLLDLGHDGGGFQVLHSSKSRRPKVLILSGLLSNSRIACANAFTSPGGTSIPVKCQCRVNFPHLCRSKIPQFVDQPAG